MNAKIRITIAVLTTCAGLVAAGPASAQPVGPTTGGKSCSILFVGTGQSLVYADGTGFSVTGADNKKHTYTCRDGKWEETVSIVRGSVPPPRGVVVGRAGASRLALR
jgi:hypothetical protein